MSKLTVVDVDCTMITSHSDAKEGAAGTFKGGFGFHPVLAFLDATGEALASILRPGNAVAFGVRVDGVERIVVAAELRKKVLRNGERIPLDRAASAIRAAVDPVETSATPASESPRASSSRPVLS